MVERLVWGALGGFSRLVRWIRWRRYFNPDRIPFEIRLVAAGSRIGYRWESRDDHPCEAIWLDPEPDLDSSDSDYDEYIEELEEIERQVVYRGFQQPPTEEEYFRLVSELED